MQRLVKPLIWAVVVVFASPLHAQWLDPAWTYRREVTVDWPAERATGIEQAQADIYTAGHHVPSGDRVRVTTEEGRITPATVLMTGPGDSIRVAFSLVRGARRYYIYFGNASPAPLKPTETFTHTAGLLLEMRGHSGGVANNPRQMETAWAGAKPLIGRALVPRLFQGFNPFGEPSALMARYTGTLNVPADGTYTLAASASHRGVLLLDGRPALIAGLAPDARFSAKADLKRGKHDFVFYQSCLAGEPRLSVAWKRPDSTRFEVIPAEAFGNVYTAAAGPMEQHGNPLFADFKVEYLGECFFSDHYSHRYRFTAQSSRYVSANQLKYEWDLGCGQKSTDSSVEMVYLTDGIYPITLTLRQGSQADTQTTRLAVRRLYERLDSPPTDVPSKHAEIVAGYDLASLPSNWLAWYLLLQTRTRRWASMEKAGLLLATLDKQPDTSLTLRALSEASNELVSQDKVAIALRIWDAIPPASALQPQAGIDHGQLLLWRSADFTKAVRILEPLAKAFPRNQPLQRLLGQALVLDQRADEGQKILEQLPIEGSPEQQAAHAGAIARSIEFYITEKDPEAGQEFWERWQQEYPADFLDGYSALLQSQLMELNKLPVEAARLAEAFATAVPKSSYAPRLLDRASKLLAKLDPQKSQALRALLKKKYPEDPLSQ